ncbi:uncharacterized protein MONOS_16284 [Monocercomonoides exilis]|uniref:uncharacterized protein n=1 Tax=Monocercomonoides exilis TaxID=2049356 RepID=UPI00355ABB80|nr:hypothetical protein MONOS_16284 [Monocercomonoides exilis]|eukprot:MONOS_16284.1-p1 / transcript=MONOS_16284.1 / gene=MONOS_16284 / organism=Monocercomonoides_exilis_PA203 / gene_product=unspecified product / transcript_product=unspecified product / location=Mono_scaffold01614:3502-5834(+) / protein_length=530 / sequence_SO=supercontig / SO=protein_coding / is_pseudo=false
MGKDNEGGAFDLSGSIGVLTNITLKGWRRGGEIYSGRLFGGKGYGGEKGGSEGKEKGGEGGRGKGREGDGDGEGIEGTNDACSPSTAMSTKTTCMMISCSFSSVCDAYDGGIVPSLNNPYASLTASNTSFIGCCRTRNVVCEGNADRKLKPDRQNETFNGANTFTWCEWSGSRTTGESDSVTDGVSSGGAICMYNLNSGELTVSHCLFNNCFAYSRGGGIMCHTIKSVRIENNVFNACTAQNHYGGGLYVYGISTCVRISGCEFQNCKASYYGGGLYLDNFQVSGSGCIGTESGGGESACVFDCSFTSCSITNTGGGGMFCKTVPATQFKMRSVQFISCSAFREGGGLYSGNPFYECYTTNADDRRMCYAYNYSNAGAWTFQHTEKKDWLKDKTIYVSVNGNDSYELCGANTTFPCLTVKKAFEMCEIQISLTITLMDGDHQSEATTNEIGEKKISVIGKGSETSSIGTGALSSPSAAGALFSVTTGHLRMNQLKIDCNSTEGTSPSVVVVSYRSGTLSLVSRSELGKL